MKRDERARRSWFESLHLSDNERTSWPALSEYEDLAGSLVNLLLVQPRKSALALKFLRLGDNHLDPACSQRKCKV